MRIIGGTLKGRLILPPSNFKARPTTDFAKESLFNILNNIIDYESVDVLDLFSGTGSISYEFASRGSLSIDSVEIEPDRFKFICRTVNRYGFSQIRPIRNDVFKFLKFCKKKYDLIFADPPFDSARLQELPEKVFKYELMKPNGIFILEHSGNHNFSESPYFVEIRSYGSVNFSFFK